MWSTTSDAVALHVRICGGGAGRPASLLQLFEDPTSLAPQVEGGLGIQRQGQSAVSSLQAPGGRVSTQYSASIGVHYRLDLAGSNRRALEALAARADYRRYELQGAQLALAGNIAAAAIRQAALAAQIGVTQELVKAQEEQVLLTRERVRLGQAAHREVLTLYSQLEQTRSGLPAFQKQLQQGEHLLAVLGGRAPGAGGLPRFTLADFSLPSELPYVLPRSWCAGARTSRLQKPCCTQPTRTMASQLPTCTRSSISAQGWVRRL